MNWFKRKQKKIRIKEETVDVGKTYVNIELIDNRTLSLVFVGTASTYFKNGIHQNISLSTDQAKYFLKYLDGDQSYTFHYINEREVILPAYLENYSCIIDRATVGKIKSANIVKRETHNITLTHREEYYE